MPRPRGKRKVQIPRNAQEIYYMNDASLRRSVRAEMVHEGMLEEHERKQKTPVVKIFGSTRTALERKRLNLIRKRVERLTKLIEKIDAGKTLTAAEIKEFDSLRAYLTPRGQMKYNPKIKEMKNKLREKPKK